MKQWNRGVFWGFCLPMVFLLMPLSLQAAELQLPKPLLQLQQQALEQAPSLQAQWQMVRQAEQQLHFQKSLQKPKVTLKSELSYAWMKQDFARTANQLAVTYPLYAPNLSAAEQVAEASQLQKHWQVLAAQRNLWKQVGLTFIQLLKQQEQVLYSQRQLQAMKDILTQLKARYQVGMTQLNDIAEVESRIALMQADSLVAQQRVQELWQKLVAQSGVSKAALHKLLSPLMTLTTQDALQQTLMALQAWQKKCPKVQNSQPCLSEKLLEQHPILGAIQQKQWQLQQQAQKVAAKYQMKVQAVGSYVYNNSGNRFYDDMQGVKVGIQLNLPLYLSGESDAAVAEVRAQQQQLRQQWQQQKLNLLTEAQIAMEGLHSLAEQIPVFQAAVQASEQALKATHAGLQTGERSILDVLNAQRDLDLMRKRLHIALYEVWRYQILWQFVNHREMVVT